MSPNARRMLRITVLALVIIAALSAPGARSQDAAVQAAHPQSAAVPTARPQNAAAPAAHPQDAAVPAAHPRAAAPVPVRKPPPKARPQTLNAPIGITVQVIPGPPMVFTTSLAPPSPNPLIGSTTIHYSLARPSYVSIRIYGITGEEAAKLVEWHFEPGNYTLTWDGTGPHGRLPPGVYLCRMVAGPFTKSQRIVLIR